LHGAQNDAPQERYSSRCNTIDSTQISPIAGYKFKNDWVVGQTHIELKPGCRQGSQAEEAEECTHAITAAQADTHALTKH
jgi:hypothetical protein